MTPAPFNQRRIIPAAEFGQIRDAADLVAAALQSAADMHVKAEDERQEARKSGYQDGFADGLRKASEALAEATGKAERELGDLDHWIGPVVLKAVAQIVGSMDMDDRIRRIIARAIADTAATQTVSLYVAPEDEALVRRAAEGLNHSFDILVDPLLSGQEMVMETSMSRAHIGMREQIIALVEAAGRG
ncbi:type III secretion system stator protein SctL [Agrobacterium rhizogenes]|uniref:HrpE/YscL family type III secretion apparatus protein n=1 Tax=Rhizobium rhizogenes NBRC 13257 TaxID=1220581 RepID=A0AA87U4B5_RHIRH|nr:type III secretion system stator protein SctL [Rhizobium rhizogenes]MDJ1636655.1 type III secretion system stator protein SctL [Rhizobium rhizogenes]NTF58292.1 type III secretion system stator protein SctL [Rhizobium rhizogenes]NTF77874.1 type III secretion system stator protein SctL [Rhizobium rhizogenes]NTF96796.1 type III secretion system stator protein SctL [Rhizobium rhizogenes]NTG03771.1 type III secretion system stator protein SctL [Rhizobium rhizogenes]